jgi:predicted nucleotidyltransferase
MIARSPEAPPDALAAASLSNVERRMVRRVLALLRTELGGDLHAVWLYGSRARGQAPHPESDIDMMAIADGGSARYGMKAIELVNQAADEQGQSPAWYSLQLHDPAWVRSRREIRSFFIREVDRDKIVLYGDELR